ncbi:type II toxin-antitoxin system prevent-host-death family antitoxin [Tessaracoccus caeni]|uniref:type II toxin-antitoxin system prevent-host-death family antitoxin n=1 Tax=Tessaracoccus caeni TaxID=3031239 RepID=UPI0038738E42
MWGVREFRRDLADYIDGDEPVTVTRHGRRVGVFIPTHGDREEAVAAYQAASGRLRALMAEHGADEDEIVAEFDKARRAARKSRHGPGES